MRTRLLLATVLVACAAPRSHAPRGEPVLSIGGSLEGGTWRFGQDDLPTLPRRSFHAIPPWKEDERSSFAGIAIARVLADDIEPKAGADTAVFHGEHGMLAAVPLPMVRQLRPVLADRVDGEPVAAWRASAAPFQLAWPNLDQPGIDSDPRLRWWWVGGVGKIELQRWSTSFGKALRVPAGAANAARLGAEALSTACIGCHRVRGAGGTRGPELTTATVKAREAFAAAMRQHLRRVSGAASAPEVTASTASSIAAFLDAIQLAPEQEDEPEAPPEEQEPELPPPEIGVPFGAGSHG